jgi:hypothetical protein
VQYTKNIAAAFLIAIYFLSGTVTCELLKLPFLASHYYDHKEERSNTNLLSFVINHYYIEDGTDKDAAEDSQLPFKSPESFMMASSVISLPPAIILYEQEKPVAKNISRFYIRNDVFISTQYLSAIWQPPRYC